MGVSRADSGVRHGAALLHGTQLHENGPASACNGIGVIEQHSDAAGTTPGPGQVKLPHPLLEISARCAFVITKVTKVREV